MSKLTWHFQNYPLDVLDVMNGSKARWVKGIDPSWDFAPEKRIIGRHYIPDGEVNALIMKGRSGAWEWFDRSIAAFRQAPYVHCWELPNEPPVATRHQRDMLVEFSLSAIEMMHEVGLKTVALNLSVGWPSVGTSKHFAPILRVTDYWGLHPYGWWNVAADDWDDRINGTEWHSLRYRRMVREMGIEVPPLLMTECGLEPGGWKKFTNYDRFREQLTWWDDELEEDDYVECATIFTSGPGKDWWHFDFNLYLSRWLADRLNTLPPGDYPDKKPLSILESIRQGAWDEWDVPYNPDAAFALAARERELGVPVTREMRQSIGGTVYASQGFAGGIVYCKEGDWDAVEIAAW